MDYMRQCVLTKDNLTTVAWIDECHAKKGNSVKLKEYDTVWQVSEVGKARITKTEAHSTRSDVFESIKPKERVA